jgi:hypothetical protein
MDGGSIQNAVVDPAVLDLDSIGDAPRIHQRL